MQTHNQYRTSTFGGEPTHTVESRARNCRDDVDWYVAEGRARNPEKKTELAWYPQFQRTGNDQGPFAWKKAHDLCKKMNEEAGAAITHWVPSGQDTSKALQELGIKVSFSRWPIQNQDGNWGTIVWDIGAVERFHYIVEARREVN